MSVAIQFQEKRRAKRHSFDLGVRFILNNTACEDARLLNISTYGAAIIHQARPAIGEGIIVYIENLDRFAGRITRLFRKGFAIEFEMGERKRRRLFEKIDAMAQGETSGRNGAERRTAQRISGGGETVLCRFDNGETVECAIIDCTIANASLRSIARPFLGSEVQVGQSRARVVRHTRIGFAVEFADYWNARPPADSYVIYD